MKSLKDIDMHKYVKYILVPVFIILAIITVFDLFQTPTNIEYILEDFFAFTLILFGFLFDLIDQLEEKMGLKKNE